MRTAVSIVLFLALSGLLYSLSWNSQVAGFLSDDAIYLLMADWFSPYRATESDLVHYVLRQSQFPPLYPMLIAGLGGGSSALLLSHLITTTTLVLALIVYGFWIRFETGNRLMAVWLVLMTGLLPGVLLQDLQIMSEFPYLLLSLSALWLAARKPIAVREYALIALCVGLAAVTRSAGLSLLLAFGIWLLWQRAPRRVVWLAIALAPALIWVSYKTYALGDQGGYGSLWKGLWLEANSNGLAHFAIGYIVGQGKAAWQGLLTDIDFRAGTAAQVALALVLLSTLPVWLQRLWSRRLDALYLATGGAMTLLYPFPEHFNRLLLPFVPLLLLYSCLGVCWLASALTAAARARFWPVYGFLAALSLAMLTPTAFIVRRFAEPIEPELTAWKHTPYWFSYESARDARIDIIHRRALLQATREVEQWVPEGTCMYGVRTALSMLYSRRITYQPPVPGDDPAKPFEHLPTGCSYFLLIASGGNIGSVPVAPFYPGQRLPHDDVEMVHLWEDALNPGTPAAVLLRAKPSTRDVAS